MKYDVKMKENVFAKVKDDFPILFQTINGKRLVYLDSAATSLTPKQVVKSITDYYEKYNANIHRGIHSMGERATLLYEEAHAKVATFIKADSEEIIFTKNTTESLNLLAYSLCSNFKKGDNVVVTEMEHHSNLVPWQQQAKIKGFEIRFAPMNENGELNLEKLKNLIDNNTKVVAVTHVSNVLGTINPIKEIAEFAHNKNALIVVDAAQSVPHISVNVKDLDVDFLAFSGHKMMGPTGIGVLYGKKYLLEELEPFLYGGDMIKEVTKEKTEFNDLPWKFEAGTPNIADGIALGAAVDYINSIGIENIANHNKKLVSKAIKVLKELGAEVYGPEERVGVVSFNFKNIHPHDVCSLLDEEGVAIRGGHNCAMPLHEKLGVTGSCRVCFHIYNDEEDIMALENALNKVKKVFS